MTRKVAVALVSGLLMLGLLGCEEDPTTTEQGKAAVTGVIRDAGTGEPLAGVTVQVSGGIARLLTPASVVTGPDGVYRFEFELDSLGSVTLSLSKSGYRNETLIVELRSGSVEIREIRLTAVSPVIGGGGGTSSGFAQTIAFIQAEPQEISVYGVGGLETSILTWEVRDSLGLPIDAAHALALDFSIAGGPGGGEYISPPRVTTNAQGRAVTTFNSGIRSGVVMIVATGTVGTRTITSSPVRLVIHGGLPHQAHFTVGPQRHNFPTLGIFGLRNPITVLVGDRYSNPVVENTAVYFRSSAGVIQASVFTDRDGQGTADLISGNPYPFGIYAASAYGDGYHYVVARTVGEGGTSVQDSTLMLWSGRAQITNISPSPFNIPNGGAQVFTFVVSDYLGHPLARGTTITVTGEVAPPNQARIFFGVNGAITLGDVIFPGAGTTIFTCTMADATPDTNRASPAQLSIFVTGPNGDAHGSASGILN